MVSSHPIVKPSGGIVKSKFNIHRTVFVAPTAKIVGSVKIGRNSSVWYGAVIRGDIAPITIGSETNIQDGAILHVGKKFPCRLGNRVSVGHGAMVHGATVKDDVLVAMGAIVMNGAVIGERSIVGAGAVVTEGTIVPPGSIVIGVPARVNGSVRSAHLRQITQAARHYIRYALSHRAALAKTPNFGLPADGRNRLKNPTHRRELGQP